MVEVKNNEWCVSLEFAHIKTFASQRHPFSTWLFCSLHFILAVTTALSDIPALYNLQRKGAELGGSGKTSKNP